VLQVGGTPRDSDVFSFTVGGKDLQVKIIDADATNLTYRVSVDDGTTFTNLAGADADQTASGNSLAGTADAIAAAINNYTSTDYVGLTAVAGSDGSVTLSQAINFSSSSFDDGAAAVGTLNADGDELTLAGIDASAAYSFVINGHTVSFAASTTDAYDDTVVGQVARINDTLALAANADKLGGLTLVATAENSDADIKITATAATTALLDGATSSPAASTSALSVTSAADARTSIVAIDAAITAVNTQRANLGAVSNRLDNTVANLSNIAINLEDGRSRIEDADFAAESANLAKNQIMLQAGTAMLAQANASQQNVLSLLG
jgi:flagellin